MTNEEVAALKRRMETEFNARYEPQTDVIGPHTTHRDHLECLRQSHQLLSRMVLFGLVLFGPNNQSQPPTEIRHALIVLENCIDVILEQCEGIPRFNFSEAVERLLREEGQ